MNLNNFICFGTFSLEGVYINEIKSGYQGDIFLTLEKETSDSYESPEFIGVILQEREPEYNLNRLKDDGYIFNTKGKIFKNPKTHKILYVIESTKDIKYINGKERYK